jgi:pyruvate dehydrogenase E1 component
MPDYWQFPTVSMGLGPLMAIYQARFLKYLHRRGLADTAPRKVWAFLGDGETDEPESLGAISLAGRERLDNLVFVINCNLQRPRRAGARQRQDHPGAGGHLQGAGWNVIKTIWGSGWDPLIARDSSGILLQRMEEAVDGEYQDFKSKNGAYVREHFFGKYPELKAMVAGMTDDQVWALARGGTTRRRSTRPTTRRRSTRASPPSSSPRPSRATAWARPARARTSPTSRRRWARPPEGVPRPLRPAADRRAAREIPFLRFEEGSPELNYLRERRRALAGPLPARRRAAEPLAIPPLAALTPSSRAPRGGRSRPPWRSCASSTRSCATSRSASGSCRSCPTNRAPSAWRGCFRQFGIFSQVGQLYRPQDADQLMFYKEDKAGQILQEGINEPGATASWIAAATSYSTSNVPMIPFYIYYSMFGFQRVGDLLWAACDMRAAASSSAAPRAAPR